MTAKKKPTAKRAPKKPVVPQPPAAGEAALFDRVAAILEQARGNVVRAVNSNMVLAYWLIGREIVQEIQGGGKRAGYGAQVLERLARRLTERFGPGFSETSLKYFRTFYLAYQNRHPLGDELPRPHSQGAHQPIRRPMGDELTTGGESPEKSRPPGAELAIQHPAGAELAPLSGGSYPAGSELATGFSPQLSWSHYRALMRVESAEARDFYEHEAIDGGWDKRTLERQIHSFCHLKFYLLIDLKLGELTDGDVGQMDGYVRMFDDLVAIEGDNPTIGLILCTERNETVVRYSVLKDRKQIFASKYMLYLPTEEELRREIERERRLIEAARESPESL